MNILTGKTLAVTLIAGLLVLANVENRADELDLYLDDAMRMEVFQELKNNVQNLYESAVIVPVQGGERQDVHAERYGFPVANSGAGIAHPARPGALN